MRQPSWSLRIGSVAGIPIRIHVTFWLLIAWVAWMAQRWGLPPVTLVAVVLSLFGCVTLHELGHALVAKGYGIRTRDITLYPIGGISRLQSMGKPHQELWISLAGPAVNFAIAAAFGLLLRLTGQSLLPANLASGKPSFLQWMFFGNAILAVFNIVPAFPMDGGRILRAALALGIGRTKATEIAALVGQALAVLMGLAALLSGNIVLMFIALFVFLGAGGEAEMLRTVASTDGYRMRDAMVTEFEGISHGDTLGDVVKRLLRTNQEDFPVLHGDRVLGVLTRRQLVSSIAADGADALVAGAMQRDFPRVAPEEHLSRALDLLKDRYACPLMVFDNDRLVGMITSNNLLEFLAVARAGAAPRADAAQ